MLIKLFEGYKPIILPKIIYWKAHIVGMYKCNIVRASKGNSRPSVVGICIRNWNVEFIYAASHNLGGKTGLKGKVIAQKNGLQFCLE